ncbi:MAG: peptidase lon domain protein [Frankiales bacterium]|nr:peptidase lon domain protein [Frankiales bacterium]
MSFRLPLFPLGMVLFPGLVLPLHVFEERYRVLVRELLELPEDERRFGVIAIRQGREVGADGVQALYEVGCVAHLRRAQAYDDGRFDIVTTGTARFRLDVLDERGPYLTGQVEVLPDELGDTSLAPLLDRAVRAAFADYLAALADASGEEIEVPELPDSALVLGFLVAATTALDLDERQRLLALDDGVTRLSAELALLRREATLLRHLSAAPAPELARAPISLN